MIGRDLQPKFINLRYFSYSSTAHCVEGPAQVLREQVDLLLPHLTLLGRSSQCL